MAKVVVTIEDMPGQMVRMTANPSFETMITAAKDGHEITAAQAYAMKAMRLMAEEAKSKRSKKTLIEIPRIG